MSLSPYVIYYLAIYQLLFLSLIFLIRYRHERVSKYFIAFCLSLICVIVDSLPEVSQSQWTSFIIGRPASMFTGTLWLLTFEIFNDDREIPKLFWSMLIVGVLGRAFGSLFFNFNPEHPSASLEFAIGYVVPQITWVAFCAHSAYIVLDGYKADLIGSRRTARLAFIICMGAIISLAVTNGAYRVFGQFINLPIVGAPVPSWLFILGYLLSSAGFGLSVLSLKEGVFVPTPMSSPTFKLQRPSTGLLSSEQKVIDQITHSMNSEKLFTQQGLTISTLAKHLREQEYKLRQIINQQLKYNNFSHFLNHYRIKEAEQRLRTTNDSISKIGLDVGYTSLSSFHKAFREQHSITPREYRMALLIVREESS